MSALTHIPERSWASAHRVLLTVLAIVLALAVAVTIALVVSRTTGGAVSAPGGSLNRDHSVPTVPQERCIGNVCAK